MTTRRPTTNTSTSAKLIERAASAIGLADALTTVHHIYGGLVDSAPNRLRVPIIMAIPSAVAVGSLYRYRRTGSRAALITAGAVGGLAWVALSGLLHGSYAHAYKDLLFLLNGPSRLYYPLNPSEHYPPDDPFFEITGVLEIGTAFLVASSMYRVIRDMLSNSSAGGVSSRVQHEGGYRHSCVGETNAKRHRRREGAGGSTAWPAPVIRGSGSAGGPGNHGQFVHGSIACGG